MGDVVNLNKARKGRARRERAASAVANRVRFGLPKAERTKAAKAADSARQTLDGKRLD